MNHARLLSAFALLAPFALLTLLVGGCASSTGVTSGPTQTEPTVIDLKRGMTPDQVRSMLGQPAEVQVPKTAEAANIEVWIYRRPLGSRIDSVSPTMMEEPWVDPLTGILYFLERPNPSERRVDFIEELHLYFASGILSEANRTVKRQYQFSQ